MEVWEIALGVVFFVGLPIVELYAWSSDRWWHESPPRDPRNGI